MPAAVLVVHDDRDTRELAIAALRRAFLEVVGFADPMTALDAIEASSRVRVLVTRVLFRARHAERRRVGPHGPNEADPAPRSCLLLARKTHLTRKVSARSCRDHLIRIPWSRRSAAC